MLRQIEAKHKAGKITKTEAVTEKWERERERAIQIDLGDCFDRFAFTFMFPCSFLLPLASHTGVGLIKFNLISGAGFAASGCPRYRWKNFPGFRMPGERNDLRRFFFCVLPSFVQLFSGPTVRFTTEIFVCDLWDPLPWDHWCFLPCVLQLVFSQDAPYNMGSTKCITGMDSLLAESLASLAALFSWHTTSIDPIRILRIHFCGYAMPVSSGFMWFHVVSSSNCVRSPSARREMRHQWFNCDGGVL